MQTTDWYVPNVTMADLQSLPEGLTLTLFDPAYYAGSGLTTEKIRKDYAMNAKATGEYVCNFSPSRLALHETIVGISILLKMENEEYFIQVAQSIYSTLVLPLIQAKKNEFEKDAQEIQKEVRANATAFFKQDNTKYPNTERLEQISIKFNQYLQRYQLELQQLEPDYSKRTRAVRDLASTLERNISYMQDNREAIVTELVENAAILESNRKKVQELIFGTPEQPDLGLLFQEPVVSQYKRLTLHTQESRKGFLIVGGAASGKGSVTTRIKYNQDDPTDVVELNPDLYKRLLKPFDEMGEHITLHGSLTHNESSIVFDAVAERWQAMAKVGKAPNILMDVARAGGWMRGMMGTGGTSVQIHTPILPLEVALKRSYVRGQRCGRFMPTEDLLQGHKDQVAVNLSAMQSGVDVTLYNNNVSETTSPLDLPIAAHYSGQNKHMTILDMSAMYDYFQKAEANVQARTAEELCGGSPRRTVATLLKYAAVMTIKIEDQAAQKTAAILFVENGKPVFTVYDWSAVEKQMGHDDAESMLQGMIQNEVAISGDPVLMDKIEKVKAAQLQSTPRAIRKSVTESKVGVGNYAAILRDLLHKGREVIRASEIYIYIIRGHEDEFPHGVTIHTEHLYDATKSGRNTYQNNAQAGQDKVLVIGPHTYPDPHKRREILEQIKLTGFFKGPGVYMNVSERINSDFEMLDRKEEDGGLIRCKPLPTAARLAIPITDQYIKSSSVGEKFVFPTLEGECTIEPNISVMINKKNVPALRAAVAEYDRTSDSKLLVTEDGFAKHDVYGSNPFFIQDHFRYVAMEENKYRTLLQRVLTEGKQLVNIFSPHDEPDIVLALQLQPDEFFALPFNGVVGKPVEAPNCIALSQNDIPSLQRDLDLGTPLILPEGPKYAPRILSQDTLEKSFKLIQEKHYV